MLLVIVIVLNKQMLIGEGHLRFFYCKNEYFIYQQGCHPKVYGTICFPQDKKLPN